MILIDFSAISVAAIAQELSEEPIKTFCIGFKEEKFNEAKYAKEVSAHLGRRVSDAFGGAHLQELARGRNDRAGADHLVPRS